nr:protein OBERON 1-like isoform X1 [Ipomoea batatas]
MDFDSPDTNVRRTPRKTKDGLHFYPVSPGGSGEGLPYAPEDWPNPGDKWRWKVGKRVKGSGYSKDRYLYLPRRLVKAGQPKSFQSKFSVEQYVQSAFPGTDVNAFFASFRWNIPLKWFNSKGVTSVIKASPRRRLGVWAVDNDRLIYSPRLEQNGQRSRRKQPHAPARDGGAVRRWWRVTAREPSDGDRTSCRGVAAAP